MKTLPQIAKDTGINISTLRYRIEPYKEFLICTTTNKVTKYSIEAEEIISEINTYIGQGRQREEITSILSMKYQREFVQTTQQPQQKPNDDANDQVKEAGVNGAPKEQCTYCDKVAVLSNTLALFLKMPNIKEYVGYALYNQARQQI
jgi:hypothetical protein